MHNVPHSAWQVACRLQVVPSAVRDVSGPQVGSDSAQAAVQQPPKTVPVVQDGKISNWPGFEAVLHSLLYDKVGAMLQTGSLHASHHAVPWVRWDSAQVLCWTSSCTCRQTHKGIRQAVKVRFVLGMQCLESSGPSWLARRSCWLLVQGEHCMLCCVEGLS